MDDGTPLVRTDFSDVAEWGALVVASTAESPEGFCMNLRVVDDSRFEGRTVAELLAADDWPDAAVLFVADRQALSTAEHPILCVDLLEERGRSFRCAASQVCGVENNLSLANMDFEEFVENTDADGVFRGFR